MKLDNTDIAVITAVALFIVIYLVFGFTTAIF